MNILLTIYFPHNCGGAEISTLTLAQELKKLGHKVVIASTAPYPEIKSYSFKPYRSIPFFCLQNLYLSKFLKNIIKREEIDIIHASDGLTSIGAIKAAKKTNIPIVTHLRDYWFACPNSSCLMPNNKICDHCSLKDVIRCPPRRMIWNVYKYFYLKLARRILETADWKIANSTAVKKKLISNDIKEKISILPITRDLSNFTKEKQNLRKRYNLKGTVITFLGSLIESKGILFLMSIMPKLLNKYDTTFLIVGDGELENELKDKVKKQNLQDKIILAGKIQHNDIPKIYNSSDIIVFPSLWEEPFGGITLEAMASKLPVLGSSIGGIKDTILDKKTGFLIKPGNAREWKTKLELLIKNKELRKKMGNAGYAYLKKDYDLTKITQQIIKIYKQLKKC